MPVIYASGTLIPAPFVTVHKEYQTTDDGKRVGSLFTIQLKGKIVPNRGSPATNGSFWSLSGYPPDEVLNETQMLMGVLRKQEAIRQLFAIEGSSLEVQAEDGSMPMKCNPRVRSIEFPEGQWFNSCDYTITLEADTLTNFTGGTDDFAANDIMNYKVSKATEEWNMELLDEKVQSYRLTHSVSAQGKRFFDSTGTLVKPAWQNAQDYVLNVVKLGLNPDRMSGSGVLNLNTLQGFNHFISEHINEQGGQVTATETWLCYDPQGGPAAINDYSVSYRYNIQEGRTAVSIEGNITGLISAGGNPASRYTNAVAKWNAVQPSLLTLAQNISNVTLNPIPVTKHYGINSIGGTVTYAYEFDSRPTPFTTGALSEVITVSNQNPADVFAIIPVLGRPLGPVLQAIGTVTTRQRSVNIEILMPPLSQTYTPLSPNTNVLVLTYRPISLVGVYLGNDVETWNLYTGRYTRQSTWIWE